MTPKEKARELVLKFAFKGAQHEGEAKTFAFIAVDEIINIVKKYETEKGRLLIYNIKLEYWIKVKHEIEKL